MVTYTLNQLEAPLSSPATQLDPRAARYDLEILIDAPRDHVWSTLIQRPNDWWIADMRCVAADATIALDAQAGGALVERAADGGELLWGTVLAIQPRQSLNLASAIAPPFGGPCQTYLLIELLDQGSATVVRMTHSLHGHFGDETIPQMKDGWRLLLEGLKATAEERPTANG